MRFKLNWLAGSFFAFACLAMFVVVRAKAADAPDSTAAPAPVPAAAAPEADKMAPLALPQGATPAKEAADAAKLDGSLEIATEDALKKDVGMSGVLSCFVEQDRTRLKDITNTDKIDPTALKNQTERLVQAWKDKYKEEFAFDPAKVFTNVQVVQGEIADPQMFVANWPVATISGPQGEAQQAAAKIQQLDDDTQKNGFIKKGTDIAIIRLPAEGNVPALDVSLINEPHGWKIDVPNGRTAQQINDDLVKHLAMMASDTAQWPADPNQARRAFVSHVIMALYGVDMPAAVPAAAKPQ